MRKFRKPGSGNPEVSTPIKITPYFQQLLVRGSEIQGEIPYILEKFEVFPVRNGLMDLVVEWNHFLGLINAFSQIKVAVYSFSLWCKNTPENKIRYRCPHGRGGPVCKNGFLSEMYFVPKFILKTYNVDISDPAIEADELISRANNTILKYFETEFKKELFYSPCLLPGLWLLLPRGW